MEIYDEEEKKQNRYTKILLIINLIIWTIIIFLTILWNGVVNAATTQNANGWQAKNLNDTWSSLYNNGSQNRITGGVKQVNVDYGNLTGNLTGMIYLTIQNTQLHNLNDIDVQIWAGNSQNMNASFSKSCTIEPNGSTYIIQCQIQWNAIAYSSTYYTVAIKVNNSQANTMVAVSANVSIDSNTGATSTDIQNQTISLVNSIFSNIQSVISNNNSQYNALIQELYNNNASQIAQLEAEYTPETPQNNVGDLEDIEENLHTYTNIDLNNINVDIDPDTSSWVWNTLTSILQTNALVFGMVISILSIGVIKLILDR